MKVAQTILEQIKALTPTPVFWSWGASKFEAVRENQIKGLGHDYSGALKFYVRGHHHKGHVIVSLACDDTYTVSIGNVRKGEIKPKKQIEGVYFDMLSDTIDDLIERKEEYKF